MSFEIPQNPDRTIEEECLQYGAEKKERRDTAYIFWGDNLLVMQALLLQNIFEEMEGAGLKSLIDRCEANLALLKMRKEQA